MSKQFEVAYRIDGYADERRAGPYKTEAEAESHADDIKGFVGVQYAVVVPARTKGKS